MKLKRLVEDFQVEEQVVIQPGGGPYALYRLTKQVIGTPEAIHAILERWNLSRGQVEFAGLKDKHAQTTQYVTIHSGPPRGLKQTNFELEYLGQAERPIHPRDITANRFTVVIRDLTKADVASATRALAAIANDGLPNYFDNQRFGSLGESGEFIAKFWCLGDHERALWLALVDANVHDRPDERDQKRILREHWGDWPRCKQLLAPSHRQSIVTYLADKPGDFRRTIALVRQDQRSIWLAAFQSHLWNQLLAGLIRQICRAEQLTVQIIGRHEMPFFFGLDETQRQQLHAALLPLPSARLHLDGNPLQGLYDEILAREGLELRQMRVKYPRDSFFSKGERAAVVLPGDLAHHFVDDDLYPSRQKLTLAFTLPRGSYATILAKRITGSSGDELTGEDSGAGL